MKEKIILKKILEIYHAKKIEDLRANALEVQEIVAKDENIKFKPYIWH